MLTPDEKEYLNKLLAVREVVFTIMQSCPHRFNNDICVICGSPKDIKATHHLHTLDKLGNLWQQLPHLRLGQLVSNATYAKRGHTNSFSIPDSDLLEGIESLIRKNNQ